MTASAELFVRCWLQARLSPVYQQDPWSLLMRTLIELESRERIFVLDDVGLLGATLPQLRAHTERAVYQVTRIYEQFEQQGRLDEHWRGPR